MKDDHKYECAQNKSRQNAHAGSQQKRREKVEGEAEREVDELD